MTQRDDSDSRGTAGGWRVARTINGRWQWSAYGPIGSEVGEAGTRAEAERKAQSTERRLRGLANR